MLPCEVPSPSLLEEEAVSGQGLSPLSLLAYLTYNEDLCGLVQEGHGGIWFGLFEI